MNKNRPTAESIREFLADDEIMDELSLFDVDLSPELADENLVKNFEDAISTLPAYIADKMRELNADLAKISRAADADAGITAKTGRISMVDRAMIVQETVATFTRSLEDLRLVAREFTQAIHDYENDSRPLVDREETFARVQEANKLLADLWQQSVEVAKRQGLSEFRRLTNNETSPEIEALRKQATGRFVIDSEIVEPMRAYTPLLMEREKAMQKQRDVEHTRENEQSYGRDFSPD